MKLKIVSSVLRLRQQLIVALLTVCLSLALTSCANKPGTILAKTPVLLPPESAMTECEIPEFTGSTWGDSALYALALKRELRICKGRLDEIISWRATLRP
ncbi:Rz1-like lysis system protein LysC [Yersinia vastinensis]|uniref:Rz1-like lysis system protein LysC n=1 Tax=Yersinia vastinensis TaxID=2890318 RepID=UPI003BB50F96